ncbi:MAG TPA: hypothetical protein VNT30_07775 [Stellaceae bacterium]|nr:hypothetical protein [Stellaceae bacterium]
MAQEPRNTSGPKGGKPGGSRDGRPGDGRSKDGRPRGRKGGFDRDGGKPRTPTNTFETLKELERGPDYRIDKFVLADKENHKPIKTEYRLTREGLAGTPVFSRLVDAKTAATGPLPEPEAPEPAPEAEVAEPVAAEAEAPEAEAETASAASELAEGHEPPAAEGEVDKPA